MKVVRKNAVFSRNLALDLERSLEKNRVKYVKMSEETDLDDLSIIKRGYERFLSSDQLNNAIITVRRQQQITTHFGPLTAKNKIKVSLSQEQILNNANRYHPSIKRSQSINIQKSLISPCGIPERELTLSQRSAAIRPSLIPVKIKEQPKLRALTLGPNHEQYGKDPPKYRPIRKLSAPFERRNYVAQQQTNNLLSLPLAMSQSLDKYDDLLEKFKCGICLNPLNDARVLDCLHTFCLECLYSIETVGQSKASASKLSTSLRSSSFESNKPDMSSSYGSEDSKEIDKRMSKSSIASASAKPIRKTLSVAPKKKVDEPKKSLVSQPKRPLSSITEKSKISLKCPICSRRTEIVIGGISRVPKNFLLERQLQDEMERLQTQRLSDEYCGQCYGDVQAIAYCINCEVNLCDICHEAHLRQRWTLKHDVRGLFDLRNRYATKKDNQNGPAANTMLKCFIHPAQDLKLYCLNCDVVACHNCTILLHKGHKFEPIEKAKLHIFKSLKESLQQNQKYHDYVNDSIAKLAGSVSKINAKADVVQAEIENFLVNYFDALEAHKETLLRQIAKAKEMKSLSILEQQEYLQKRVHDSQQANQFAENLLLNGNDIEILSFVGVLKNRFDFCQKSKIPIEPTISNTFQFIRDARAPATPQHHNIPVFGVLLTEEFDSN